MKRGLLWALLFSLLVSRPVSGQILYDGVLEAIGKGQRAVYVVSNVATQDGDCEISEALLTAEAERTLRRDDIPVSQTLEPTTLRISAIALPLPSQFCAVSIRVDLHFYITAEHPMLAAEADKLLIWEDHVDQTRRTVEEFVSVIANALRRARDAAQDGR